MQGPPPPGGQFAHLLPPLPDDGHNAAAPKPAQGAHLISREVWWSASVEWVTLYQIPTDNGESTPQNPILEGLFWSNYRK